MRAAVGAAEFGGIMTIQGEAELCAELEAALANYRGAGDTMPGRTAARPVFEEKLETSCPGGHLPG